MQREAEKEGKKKQMQDTKLKTNAIFGKSIENPVNKVDGKMVSNRKHYLKWSFGPTLKERNNFVMEQ